MKTWDEVSKEMQSNGVPVSAMGYCKIAFDLAKPALKWTSELPTQEGWYWYRDEDELVCLRLCLAEAGLCVLYDGAFQPLDIFIGEWYGPIEPPE